MMAQNDSVVVGIDVAKDKVDACIRAFKLRQTWSTAQGQRKLVAWLRKHQGDREVMGAAAMSASGLGWCARPALKFGSSIPGGSAASRCRPEGWPRTMRSTRR